MFFLLLLRENISYFGGRNSNNVTYILQSHPFCLILRLHIWDSSRKICNRHLILPTHDALLHSLHRKTLGYWPSHQGAISVILYFWFNILHITFTALIFHMSETSNDYTNIEDNILVFFISITKIKKVEQSTIKGKYFPQSGLCSSLSPFH